MRLFGIYGFVKCIDHVPKINVETNLGISVSIHCIILSQLNLSLLERSKINYSPEIFNQNYLYKHDSKFLVMY